MARNTQVKKSDIKKLFKTMQALVIANHFSRVAGATGSYFFCFRLKHCNKIKRSHFCFTFFFAVLAHKYIQTPAVCIKTNTRGPHRLIDIPVTLDA